MVDHYRAGQGGEPMTNLLSHPLGQSVVLPLLLVAILAPVLRLAGGSAKGPALAAVAVGAGILAAYVATLGWPPLAPQTASHKLFYLVGAGAGLGLVLDLVRAGRAVVMAALVAFALAGLAWLLGHRLDRLALWPGLPLFVVWAAVLVRLWQVRDQGAVAPAMVVAAASALAGIAILGATALVGQLAAGVAASAGAFALLNWPWPRWRFGNAGVLAAGGALGALASQLVLYTEASRWAIGLAALVFVADLGAQRVRIRGRRPGPVLRPVVVIVLALVPLAAAVAAAVLQSDDEGEYGARTRPALIAERGVAY